jgi:hypothetical protein
MMKRFVEDFNAEVHAINELVDEPTKHAEVKIEEFDDSLEIMRSQKSGNAMTASQKFE